MHLLLVECKLLLVIRKTAYFSISIIFVSSSNIFAGLILVQHMGEMYLLAKKQIASAVYQRIKYFTYIQLYVKFRHNHIFCKHDPSENVRHYQGSLNK